MKYFTNFISLEWSAVPSPTHSNIIGVGVLGTDIFKPIFFRWGLLCALGLNIDLIDGGQLRAKYSF